MSKKSKAPLPVFIIEDGQLLFTCEGEEFRKASIEQAKAQLFGFAEAINGLSSSGHLKNELPIRLKMQSLYNALLVEENFAIGPTDDEGRFELVSHGAAGNGR
jgi:hypothetical protein